MARVTVKRSMFSVKYTNSQNQNHDLRYLCQPHRFGLTMSREEASGQLIQCQQCPQHQLYHHHHHPLLHTPTKSSRSSVAAIRPLVCNSSHYPSRRCQDLRSWFFLTHPLPPLFFLILFLTYIVMYIEPQLDICHFGEL